MNDMAANSDLETIRTFVDDFNRGDAQSVGRFIGRKWFTHVPERAEPGAGDVLAGLAADLRGSFPDLSIRIDELAPRGDELHGRITISGTHSGSLWNAPPTGKRVEWTTEVTLRKAGDAFAANFDDVTPPVGLALLRQIDLVNP